jgi:membrane protein
VAVVFWTYYSAFLFLLGGEVAQAYELRRNELARLEASDVAARSVVPAASPTRPPPATRPTPKPKS